jgi:hypothetical protein
MTNLKRWVVLWTLVSPEAPPSVFRASARLCSIQYGRRSLTCYAYPPPPSPPLSTRQTSAASTQVCIANVCWSGYQSLAAHVTFTPSSSSSSDAYHAPPKIVVRSSQKFAKPSCPRRHLTRDLAGQLALSLSLITPNKLINLLHLLLLH